MNPWGMSRYKSNQLASRFRKNYNKGQEIDPRLKDFLEDLCKEGLYYKDNDKSHLKYKWSIIFFIICLVVYLLFCGFKLMIVGTGVVDDKSIAHKYLTIWDQKAKFNLI